MALLLGSWTAELVLVLWAVWLGLYLWFQRGFRYWQDRGVPSVQPSFPFGNLRRVLFGQESIGDTVAKIYRRLPEERFVGFYGFRRPMILARDPEFIRHILVKDFATFHDRGLHVNFDEPLNRQIFFLPGKKWRQLRIKLSPTFTSGKLKAMFQTLETCGRQMVEVVEEQAARGEELEVRELVARFTTDIIASVAFGIETNCQRNPEHEFRQWGRKVFEPTLNLMLNFVLPLISPTLVSRLKLKDGTSHVSEYFRAMVAHTVAYREENNVRRKDFMDLLIQLKNKGYVDPDKGETVEDGHQEGVVDTSKLTMEELAAQAFVFFVAGFETSSTTSSFTLHELSLNPDVQTKLQKEIDAVLRESGGDISYDAIGKMTYLDKVVSETLRKYPSVLVLNRECSQHYEIPDSGVVLEKGTPVAISVMGLHRDPNHYPDPERFDPERFSDEAKQRRHPYVYLPFGEGPRICIGMRLGLLQTKVGLVYLLSRYNVRPTSKTVANLEFNPRAFVLLSKSGIHVRFEKRL